MKTATIRQVRNDFGTVLAWIGKGESVTVLNRSRPVARILPPEPERPKVAGRPDFAARARALFGDRTFARSAVEGVLEFDRGAD